MTTRRSTVNIFLNTKLIENIRPSHVKFCYECQNGNTFLYLGHMPLWCICVKRHSWKWFKINHRILYIFSVFKMGNQYETISTEICAQNFNQFFNLSKDLSSPAAMALRWSGEYCRIRLKLLQMCIFFVMAMKKMLGSYCVLENILDAMSWLRRLLKSTYACVFLSVCVQDGAVQINKRRKDVCFVLC